jgi:hypothetical protein
MENAKVDGKSLYPANSMDYAELKKWLDPAQRSNLCFGKWYLSSSPDKKEGRIARRQHVLLGAFTPSNLGRTIVSLQLSSLIAHIHLLGLSTLLAGDANLLGAAHLTQRNIDRQDAVLIIGRDLVSIDRLGESHGALE